MISVSRVRACPTVSGTHLRVSVSRVPSLIGTRTRTRSTDTVDWLIGPGHGQAPHRTRKLASRGVQS